MKEEAYKALVKIQEIIGHIEVYSKVDCDLPQVIVSELNQLGDLGLTIEAYMESTYDKNMVEKVGMLPKFNLCNIFDLYEMDNEIGTNVANCIRSLYNVAQMSNQDNATPDADMKQEKPHYSKDNEDEAKKRFESLVNGSYLPQNTPLDDWLYIYGVSGKKPNNKPINWQKTQIELGYLVRLIWQNTDTHQWAICEQVFTIKGKKPNIKTIKSKLSSIDNGYSDKPKSFQALEEALKA